MTPLKLVNSFYGTASSLVIFRHMIRAEQVALFFNVDNMSNETKIWLPCKVSQRMLEGFEKEDFQKHQQNKG